MRYFFSTALVVASLAGHIYGHRPHSASPYDEGRPTWRRKTLGFGPSLPHARFHASPYSIQTNSFTPMDPSMDPMDVARIFLDDVLNTRSLSASYKIRDDSYTDKNTGVTHVYARQLINGIEVVDGDVNINIKDGMVLSYGNSFYNGPAPAPFSSPSVNTLRDPRQEACDELYESTNSLRFDSEQVIMGAKPTVDQLDAEHILRTNCEMIDLPSHHNDEDMADFRPALLKLMATVTPNSQLASDILNNFPDHRDAMVITPTDHFAPGEDHAPSFVVDKVPDAVNPVKAKLAYVQVPDESGTSSELLLVWQFEVEMQDNWYSASVSASAPHKIMSIVDWASDAPYAPVPKVPATEQATYNVFHWGVNDPACGERSVEKENFDPLASPVGWHAIPYSNDPSFKGVKPSSEFWRNTTTTWGNNVFAQENWEGQNSFIDNYRPDAGKGKAFDFTYDPQETEKPEAMDEAQRYINATISQLFYTTNLVHDFYYRYGFDEVSGNFQAHNFGRGGRENDAVIANAQDGSGFNNANFMTPPDGQNGRMRMYLWNTALPYRDGDLEAGIVIHELSHGLSTRLTGGPANSNCLGWGEAGGMGEGWGDFLATTIRSSRNYSDYAMGAWAANRERGIRNYPYSLDETVNPSMYKTLDKPGYWGVHAIGEVWAEMLWVVSQKLIAKHGYSDDLFPPPPLEDGTIPDSHFYRKPTTKNGPLVPKHGNALMVQLVLNGMKLQPCRPGFFEARQAIIQADQVLTGGENFCELWEGFASRGLGEDAEWKGKNPWGGGIRTNGYAVPLVCRGSKEPETDA